MNDCCKKTYLHALKEVRLSIKKLGINNIYELLGMLNIVILNLEVNLEEYCTNEDE